MRLNGNGRFDARHRIVVQQEDIVVADLENTRRIILALHLRQRPWCSAELFHCLLQVVAVEMGVAEGVDEVANRQTTFAGHQLGQQGVGRNVKGDAEKNVSGSLVQLATKSAFGYVELEYGVARRQSCLGHFGNIDRVPGGDDMAAAVGIVLDGVDHPS